MNVLRIPLHRHFGAKTWGRIAWLVLEEWNSGDMPWWVEMGGRIGLIDSLFKVSIGHRTCLHSCNPFSFWSLTQPPGLHGIPPHRKFEQALPLPLMRSNSQDDPAPNPSLLTHITCNGKIECQPRSGLLVGRDRMREREMRWL